MEVSPTVIKAMIEAMEVAGYVKPEGGRWTASATDCLITDHSWRLDQMLLSSEVLLPVFTLAFSCG